MFQCILFPKKGCRFAGAELEHAELADALEERDNWLLLSDLENTAVALADVRALIRASKASRSRRRPGARR